VLSWAEGRVASAGVADGVVVSVAVLLGGAEGAGLAGPSLGDPVSGVRDGGGVAVGDGEVLVVGGGARGTEGPAGALSAPSRSGRAIRVTTAQAAAAPAAARASRRRAAVRRIAS
jgi:hypothetical protein